VDFFDWHTGRGQVIGPDHRAYWLHRKELSGISELCTGQPGVHADRNAARPASTRGADVRARGDAMSRTDRACTQNLSGRARIMFHEWTSAWLLEKSSVSRSVMVVANTFAAFSA
jgi:hypothetical protein